MARKQYLTWITHNVFMRKCVSVFVYVFMSVGVYIYICKYISIFSFDLFILMYFFATLFAFFRLHFSLIFFLTWGTFLSVLCYPSYYWYYSYQSVLFVFFFLLWLIFRFNKFCNFSSFIYFPLACIYGEIKLTYSYSTWHHKHWYIFDGNLFAFS